MFSNHVTLQTIINKNYRFPFSSQVPHDHFLVDPKAEEQSAGSTVRYVVYPFPEKRVITVSKTQTQVFRLNTVLKEAQVMPAPISLIQIHLKFSDFLFWPPS